MSVTVIGGMAMEAKPDFIARLAANSGHQRPWLPKAIL
jgi:hypothetical protein